MNLYVSLKNKNLIPNLMMLVGLSLFSYAAFSYVHSYWLQYRLDREWQIQQAEELKELESTATIRKKNEDRTTTFKNGDALGVIEIPKINLHSIIIEGTDKLTLKKGPGHFPGSAFPGQNGNCVIAGHRDTFFRGLGQLGVDDIINLSTRESNYTYQIVSKRVVEPVDATPLDQIPRSMLTLITCYPFNYIGPAPKRYIITAELSEEKQKGSVKSGEPLQTIEALESK